MEPASPHLPDRRRGGALPCGPAVAIAAMLAAGCVVPDLDLEGRRCPCAPGFHNESGICVEGPGQTECAPSPPPDSGVDAGPSPDSGVDAGPSPDSGVDAGPPPDSGVDAGPSPDSGVDAGPPPDSGVDAGPPPDSGVDAGRCSWSDSPAGTVAASNLRVGWTTPNAVEWRWDSDGGTEDLDEFRLVVAESRNDALACSGTARTWTKAENPELGVYRLLRTGSNDQVLETITDEHTPQTTVFGQLVALDRSGGATITNVASGATPSAPWNVLAAFAGPLAQTIVCDLPSDVFCWRTFTAGGLGLDWSGIGSSGFATAFVEFALTSDSAVPSYWTEIWLGVGPAGVDAYGVFAKFVARSDGRPRIYQLPLRVFGNCCDWSPMTSAVLVDPLKAFGVGGIWDNGSTTRLETVQIKW